MSEPRNLILERINRLTQTVADLSESHAAQGRTLTRLLLQMEERLTSMDQSLNQRLASLNTTLTALAKDVRELASEQVLLGNRIEEAFVRSARANIRLDEIEDRTPEAP